MESSIIIKGIAIYHLEAIQTLNFTNLPLFKQMQLKKKRGID